MVKRRFGVVVALLFAAAPATLRAQERGPSEADVQAAARAFEQGQAAQLQEQYARAADMFELADRLAASAPALRSAIRNHLAAGNHVRAATLALVALDRYATDATTRQVADEALQHAQTLARLIVTCREPCALTVDGGAAVTSPVESLELFVEPGAHTVRAVWDGREPVTREVTGQAGSTVRLEIEAPAAAEPEPVVEPEPVAAPEPAPIAQPEPRPLPPPEDDASGVPPWMFFAAAGVTVAVVALTLWSGLDMLSVRDDYRDDPTKERYDDGIARQTRTNVLIGVSVGLAALTAGLGALFTDWSGEERLAARGGIFLADGGGGLTLAGRLW